MVGYRIFHFLKTKSNTKGIGLMRERLNNPFGCLSSKQWDSSLDNGRGEDLAMKFGVEYIAMGTADARQGDGA